jgi:hypothetical protein
LLYCGIGYTMILSPRRCHLFQQTNIMWLVQ